VQPRHTALLALLAVVLGAFIYFYEIRGGAEREAADAQTRRLLPELDAAEVTRLEISTTDDGVAVLEREGDGWRLVEPIAFPASTSKVVALVDAVVAIEREGGLDAPGEPAAFGLGADAPRVAVVHAGERVELELGRATPVGSNRYVRLQGSEDVDFVAAHRLAVFDVTFDALRDHRVLPFETNAIERVYLRWAEAEVVVERRDGIWWLVKPIEVVGDAATIDGLISSLAYLRAEGFDDTGVGAGLDTPGVVAVLEGSAASGLRFELVVAAPTAPDAPTVLARGRDGHVFEIAVERLAEWPRRVSAYRDRTLSRFPVAAARTFEMVFDAGPGSDAAPVRIQGEFVAGGWVTSPEPMAPDRAATLVALLSHLEGDDVVAEALGPAERAALGLDPPRVGLRVWGDGASGASAPLFADVAIGLLRPGLGLYASSAGQDTVYLLDDALIADIPSDVSAFRGAFLEGDEDEVPDDGAPSVDEAHLEPELEGAGEPQI